MDKGTKDKETKTIAFVLYRGFTPLDLVGPLQVLTGLAKSRHEYDIAVVSDNRYPMWTDTQLGVSASHTFAEIPRPYAVLVPGGAVPTMRAMGNDAVLGYIRQAAKYAEVITSVCTGSLVLGAAGILAGKRATTHWAFLDVLSKFGATPVGQRWVEDGNVITAAGVAAGIDMAFHLVGRLAGSDVARAIQFGIEYDPDPPQGALNWSEAPREQWQAIANGVLREGFANNPQLYSRLVAPR